MESGENEEGQGAIITPTVYAVHTPWEGVSSTERIRDLSYHLHCVAAVSKNRSAIVIPAGLVAGVQGFAPNNTSAFEQPAVEAPGVYQLFFADVGEVPWTERLRADAALAHSRGYPVSEHCLRTYDPALHANWRHGHPPPSARGFNFLAGPLARLVEERRARAMAAKRESDRIAGGGRGDFSTAEHTGLREKGAP